MGENSNIEWVRSIVSRCKAGNVPCFVKQLGTHAIDVFDGNSGRETGRVHLSDSKGGDWNEWPADLKVRQYPQLKGASNARQPT